MNDQGIRSLLDRYWSAPMQNEESGRPSEVETMKTVRVNQYGGPETLRIEHVPVPVPGRQEVLVQVSAIGVDLDDILDRTGDSERVLPFVPGCEAAGTIAAIGGTLPD